MLSDFLEVDEAAEAINYDYDDLLDLKEAYCNDLNVPYHHNFKKTLVIKSNILINGFIPPHAQRFAIDLCTHLPDKYKNKKTKEIVFHFNPRFGQNCVVRNSYINCEWGNEEVHAAKKSPFRRGEIFIMEIYVMQSEYLISVNGIHFCNFTHRINPNSVDSIDINGDIQLLKVELSVREMYPSTEKTILLTDDPQNKTKCPFFHELKYPPMNKWDLTIIGTVKDYAERFSVDLCNNCSPFNQPYKNIIFHFNPRLLQKYVARNSFIYKEWGIEESHANQRSPFERGKQFILEFFLTESKYMVSVNGNHFCSFQHRLPPSSVDSLEISGDVLLHRIEICTKDSYPSKTEPSYSDLNTVFEIHGYCQPVIFCLNEPLAINTIIEIKGRVLLLPHEFHINLQNGTENIPHPIIPYHLSMRWRYIEDNSTVINNWIDGQWGSEVVICSLLRPNTSFTVTIYVQKEGYSAVVKAPQKPYSTVLPLLVHKTDVNIVNAIYIQGDVQIYSIYVKQVQNS